MSFGSLFAASTKAAAAAKAASGRGRHREERRISPVLTTLHFSHPATTHDSLSLSLGTLLTYTAALTGAVDDGGFCLELFGKERRES